MKHEKTTLYFNKNKILCSHSDFQSNIAATRPAHKVYTCVPLVYIDKYVSSVNIDIELLMFHNSKTIRNYCLKYDFTICLLEAIILTSYVP